VVPAGLDAARDRGPAWAAWLDRLPALASAILAEWGLTTDGPSISGYAALVLPVRTTGGRPAMLKIGWPHPEAEHEHLALKRWAGDGAVELLRADPRRFALLLERLHPEDLTDLWDVEACEIVAGFYRRIHVPALPQLRTLTSYVERWTADLAALPTGAPIPPRLVRQAVGIGRDFVADPASVGTMIHGDLHYQNVLAADREPWLVIDPKPMSGDPHYEVAPLLFNRFDELDAGTSGQSVREGVRSRFHTVVDVAGLDEHRARDWVVFRMMCNAMWGIQNPTTGRHEDLTMCVAVAKAVQD
jgi:streptomycin 6-kinase